MLEQGQALDLLKRVLSLSSAEHTELCLTGYQQSATRYANNEIIQNQVKRDTRLVITCAFGNKVGRTATNDLSEEALQRAVAKAEEIALASAPDTEYLPPPPPAEYPSVSAYDEETAHLTPCDRAKAVQEAIKECEGRGLNSAGSYLNQVSFTAVANSSGLFAFHRETMARFTCTAMGPDSSGWAESAHRKASEITPQQTARQAVEKALLGKNPKEVSPGQWTVILEPNAVAEFLGFLPQAMDAKSADEGRSAFSGKEGTLIGNSLVTLYSDPTSPLCPGSPFFADGMPVPQVTWIREGKLENLCYSRFWAQKTGHPFTGTPTNLVFQSGSSSLEEMIAGTERGLLVTRFWYIRFVDPMQFLLTGMTRDGLYLIEDGRIRYGVKNLRFNESPLRVFKEVEEVGQGRLCWDYYPTWMPLLKVSSFQFTSGTSF